jgi:hypothetical protein
MALTDLRAGRGLPRPARASGALFAIVALLLLASGCVTAKQPRPLTVIQVGPVVALPARPVIEMINDPGYPSVVEAHIARIDPVSWHEGNIQYPYSLMHVAVDRQWRQAEPTSLAVRVFGGIEGDKKYISVLQPDPALLRTGTHVLLFVSPPTTIDPGVTASTLEAFFYVDGDNLLRFDGTPADVSYSAALAALNALPASPSPTPS